MERVYVVYPVEINEQIEAAIRERVPDMMREEFESGEYEVAGIYAPIAGDITTNVDHFAECLKDAVRCDHIFMWRGWEEHEGCAYIYTVACDWAKLKCFNMNCTNY